MSEMGERPKPLPALLFLGEPPTIAAAEICTQCLQRQHCKERGGLTQPGCDEGM